MIKEIYYETAHNKTHHTIVPVIEGMTIKLNKGYYQTHDGTRIEFPEDILEIETPAVDTYYAIKFLKNGEYYCIIQEIGADDAPQHPLFLDNFISFVVPAGSTSLDDIEITVLLPKFVDEEVTS